MTKRLLMIGTDRKIFEEGSAVRMRQAEYAKSWDEVHIIVFTKSRKGAGSREISIAPNCFVYPTRSLFTFMYPFGTIRLGRFIIPRRHITEITCQDSSFTAMSGVSLKKEFGVPLEIQVHEDLGSPNFGYNIKNRIRAWMARSYLPNADKIRVVSRRISSFLTDKLKIDSSRIEVRPIAVDTEKIKSAPIKPEADLHKKFPQFSGIVLMAGRLEPEKNFELAVRAWPQILLKCPQSGLVIVGQGSQRGRLSDLVSKLGINSSVMFEPWADQATLVSYYKSADLFLNTSLFEGYGMTLVEAHAAGLKIVSTDVGVAKEVGATIVDWNPRDVAEEVASLL